MAEACSVRVTPRQPKVYSDCPGRSRRAAARGLPRGFTALRRDNSVTDTRIRTDRPRTAGIGASAPPKSCQRAGRPWPAVEWSGRPTAEYGPQNACESSVRPPCPRVKRAAVGPSPGARTIGVAHPCAPLGTLGPHTRRFWLAAPSQSGCRSTGRRGMNLASLFTEEAVE